MRQLVLITYRGHKPTAVDNVARSGAIWTGHGDLQPVPVDQARILVRYPDVWALADPADQALLDAPRTVEVADEAGEMRAVTLAKDKRLERLTKPELVALAMAKWGKYLDARWSAKRMIDQIEEWEHDLDALPSGVE